MANEFKVKNGLIVSGSADIEQDLRVRGTLTVDEFHTSITTSSIIYESGSTRFGNSLDDIHGFTGSVNITGSISLNGQAIGTGKLDEEVFNTYTSSYKVSTASFNNLTTSYNSFTSSYISDSSSFNSRIGGLESFSSSLDVTFVNETEFGSFSSSIKNFTSSLNSYTNSLENRLGIIEISTGSLNTFSSSTNSRLNSIEVSTGSLNSFTSSANSKLSAIETSTGSLNSFSSSTNNKLSAIETSTGSLNSFSTSINSFSSSIDTAIKNKLNNDGVISGSSQILNNSNIVSSSLQVTAYGFAITGSNTFKGDQLISGSIIPTIDNAFDLGSPTSQWRDVYISSGSLYIDNTKVLSSTAQELVITTDTGQSIKILEGTTDSIILQTADGDIELKSSADGDILLDPTNGKIMLKGPIEVLNGNKIQSSVGGTPVVFSSDIVVSGSIDITGTIEGIDLTAFSSSLNNRLGNLESSGGSLNTFTASAITRLNSIETSTSSLNIHTSSTNTRLSAIETSTGSLNSFTGSINTTIKNRLNAEGVISGSGQIDITQTTNYTTFSSSLATTDLNQTNKISAIETSTGSLNTFTSSASSRLNSIETSTGSINTFTSSANSRLNSIETSTSSLNSYTSSANTKFSGIESVTSSFASYSGSTNTRLNSIETSTGSLNSFTSSANTRLSSIETSTGSLNSFTNSINTTIKNRLNTEGVISGSVQITLSNTTGYSTFSSSLATTDSNQDGRLTSLEGKTGSYATTGSNIFIGNQTITGSLYVSQDLIIAGSSSIQHISSSVVNIADNIITVNAQNPSIRFGGLAVIDSGSSPQVSGSMLFDSTNDQWIFVHQNQSQVTSSILLMGPQTFNNLGNETYPTTNRILKSVNAEHVGDSNITDTGTKVSVNSNAEITGSLTSTGNVTSNANLVSNYSSGDEGGEISLNKATTNTTLNGGVTIDVWRDRLRIFETSGTNRGGFFNIAGLSAGVGTNFLANADTASYVEYTNVANKPTLVSGSSQINHNSTTNYDANQHVDHTAVSITAGNGLSGGGTIAATRTLTLDTGSTHFTNGVKSKMNTDGVVSGSSQVTYSGLSGIPSGIVSGSSQVTYSGLSGIPSGIISGSIQVDLTSTTNYVSGIKTRLNAETVLSSSAQVVAALPAGTVSGSSQVLNGTTIHSGSFFNGITVVSGSGQISFGGITGVPSGLVSGSSQVSYTGLSNIPSGIVSGSSQVSYTGLSNIPSGIVSGSSQITYGSISGIPGGIVSGSVQVDLTATTNYTSGIKTRLNAEGVVSGSAQVSIASTTGFSTYLDQAVKSGSTVTFNGATFTAQGTASSGTINLQSADSFIRLYTTGGTADKQKWDLRGISANGSESFEIRTINDANTVFSTKFTILHSGTVKLNGYTSNGFVKFSGGDGTLAVDTTTYYSSSSQVSLTGTTGFGTYLNQAVLTSSSPSFAGITSTAGITVSGTGYYTFNKPSTASYQTVALFGTTGGGIFITSDNAIISKGAYFNNGWIATSTAGSLIDFTANSNNPGIATFTGATVGNAVTFSTTQIILHAGNYNSYSPSLTGTGASGTWSISVSGNAATTSQTNFSSLSVNSNTVLHAGNYTTYTLDKTRFLNRKYTIPSGGGNVSWNRSTQTLSGTKRLIWIPSGDSGGEHINLEGAGGADSWSITGITDWALVYIRAQDSWFTSDARTSVQPSGVSITSYTTYVPDENDLVIGYVNGDTGDYSFYTSWGEVIADGASKAAPKTISGGYTYLTSNNYSSYALPLTGGQLNGLFTMSDNAYFTGAPSHGFRWNSSNNAFNNVIMRDNGNVEIRGSVIAGSVGATPQATLQVVGTMRWGTGGNSYYSYSDMDGGGLYIETVDNNTSRAKMRFQTRVNNSGSYTSYQVDANGSQHIWVINGNTRLTMNSSGDLLPGANGTQNIGSSSARWNTVFTSDLSMSNGIGDYTIVEGEEDLFIYNNKTNKVFKFLLQEVDPTIAPPKKV